MFIQSEGEMVAFEFEFQISHTKRICMDENDRHEVLCALSDVSSCLEIRIVEGVVPNNFQFRFDTSQSDVKLYISTQIRQEISTWRIVVRPHVNASMKTFCV